MKTCTKCGETRASECFPPRGAGTRNACRECENKAREDRRKRAMGWSATEPNPEDVRGALPYGTPLERASAEALLEHGSVAAAATALQLTSSQLRAHLHELERRAASRGWSPGNDMERTTPPGFAVKGVSSYYGKDGALRGQWVKTKRDEDAKYAAMLDAMSTLADRWQGMADPVTASTVSDDDLLCVYPLGDPHLGMYAWSQETGNSFDLKIAEHNLCAAMDHLVALAPPSKEALIINLGDFFHADNSSNQTARSHHALDVDTRWGKVLGVGIRAMRRLIDRALTKHEHVTVFCLIGNHDDHSAIMLALCLAQYYEREPRVTISTSPSLFQWYRFGSNLIGATHGHTVKGRDLPGVMATDQAKAWGETEHRFWYCGHVHHDSLKEFPGVTVETFRTLAARDAWHTASGYRSQRDAKLDVLHRRHGRIQRHVVGINQICGTTEEQ